MGANGKDRTTTAVVTGDGTLSHRTTTDSSQTFSSSSAISPSLYYYNDHEHNTNKHNKMVKQRRRNPFLSRDDHPHDLLLSPPLPPALATSASWSFTATVSSNPTSSPHHQLPSTRKEGDSSLHSLSENSSSACMGSSSSRSLGNGSSQRSTYTASSAGGHGLLDGRTVTDCRGPVMGMMCIVTVLAVLTLQGLYLFHLRNNHLLSPEATTTISWWMMTEVATASASSSSTSPSIEKPKESGDRSRVPDVRTSESSISEKAPVRSGENDPIVKKKLPRNKKILTSRDQTSTNSIRTGGKNTMEDDTSINSSPSYNVQEEGLFVQVGGRFDNLTLCGGCLLSPLSETETCASKIFQWMESSPAPQGVGSAQHVATAAAAVARSYPQPCHRCNYTLDHAECPVTARAYWKFDVAAPRILRARSTRLSSIPEKWRIPEPALGSLKKYLDDPAHRRHYAWEWNPSIVSLPPDQIPKNLQSNDPDKVPVYIASYRVSKKENCFDDPWINEMMSKIKRDSFKEWKDLVGIALLRADFSVAADSVLQINQQQVFRFQDPRIFLLQGQLYLGSFEKITPIWLNRPPNVTMASTVTADNYFGATKFSVILRKSGSCCNSRDCQGKNFNYFIDSKQRTMVETNPYGPHNVEEMKLELNCRKVKSMQFEKSYRSEAIPAPSFHNFDELAMPQHGLFSPPYSSDRGTTCCIEIDYPRNASQKLLMGVSHFKTQMNAGPQGFTVRSRQYFSRLYAFEPIEPYNIVAVSGAFCMGMPSAAEVEQNPYNQLILQKPLIFMGETMDCPAISFISGMTPNVRDPSKIILSYGMNDCTGRIVEVEKAELVIMLFDHGSRQRPDWTQATF